MYIWQTLLLFVLLFLSGLFSGAEVALVSLSEIEIRDLMRKKRKGAKAIRKLKKHPQRMIVTILIGNNLVNIAASVLATVVSTETFGSKGVGITIGVMTFLVLIFGEITPKSYAATHSAKVALMVAEPLLIMERVLFPFVRSFEWMSNKTLKLFGAHSKKKKLLTIEELKIAIDMGAEHNAIEHKEKRLLKNVLEFNDITAAEVMTERYKIFALDANMKIRDAIPIIAESAYSRTPLFLGSLDNIIGIVHKQDVLEAINDKEQNDLLRDIAVKPFFLNEKLKLDEIFKILQEKHIHMAIIIGKKGQTSGLITIEDIIEEILGEIIDESDVTPNKIMRISKKKILVHGETTPRYINSFFNTKIPETYETIHDFLIAEYRDLLPQRGNEIRIGDYTFHIEETSEENIERILIRKK